MNRIVASPFRLSLFTVLAFALACGQQPNLNVEQQAAAAPPAAPSAPAAAAELPPGHPATAMPAGHPPVDAAAPGAMQLAPVVPGAGEGNTALVWTTPASWVAEAPANSMRRAQYRVPGPGGEGECVVFYFGPGQGGDAQSNAERWASQFLDAEGRPASNSMRTRTASIGGIEVLFVEAGGTYQSGSMVGMGQGVAKPDWALLGAIAQGPDANWFFKLTAPRATLEANRAKFDGMLASLAKGT